MSAPSEIAAPHGRKRFALVSLKHVGLERRLAMTFWVMSFIPILLLVAARLNDIDLHVVIYPVVILMVLGYFFIARRMIRSVLAVTEKVRASTHGDSNGAIEINEQNEIGELARAFNRITQELQHKIDELESSRLLVKKLLSRIGTAIVSYEGIDNLLNLILENTVAALEAQMGSLMLVDGEKQELELKTTWSAAGTPPANGLRVKLGEGLTGTVARDGRPMRGTGTPATLGFESQGQDGALLCVPLKLRDQPIGVVTVLRQNAARPFTEDDEALVANIGTQVAVAVENYRLNLDVERTYMETIMALALAVEAKDPYSAGHSKRVGLYAMRIGQAMGLDAEFLHVLNHAGVLHDIGKIGIKDDILLKPGALTPEEIKIMQQHAVIGEAIIKPVRSLQKVGTLVLCHHERYNGSGYPAKLRGEEIPLGARILAVADTYDAMVTDRPYRKRIPVEDVKIELRKCAGTLFDPAVVDAFFRVLADRELQSSANPASS